MPIGPAVQLAAALIVRDEAEHLRRCLTSVAGVVDEIVVVDTGSRDASVDVARSFGARVLHRTWDGDFSAARNVGLAAVTADWVLYIDADEMLRPTTKAAIRERLSEPNHVAFRLMLRSRTDFTPYREYRIWRNRPDIRFAGVIHESIRPVVCGIAERESLAIGTIDLFLDHFGYEGDPAPKHRRNLPLLRQQVEADPDRMYLWAELGRTYAGLGDRDAALAAWREGATRLRRLPVRRPIDSLLMADLIGAGAASGHPDAALVAEADAMFPGNLIIQWAGALDAIARGDHAEVVRRFETVFAGDLDELADQALAFDHRIAGHWGHHARGMAHFHLGDFAAAARDFASAERLAPGVGEYRVKRQLAERRSSGGVSS